MILLVLVHDYTVWLLLLCESWTHHKVNYREFHSKSTTFHDCYFHKWQTLSVYLWRNVLLFHNLHSIELKVISLKECQSFSFFMQLLEFLSSNCLWFNFLLYMSFKTEMHQVKSGYWMNPRCAKKNVFLCTK